MSFDPTRFKSFCSEFYTLEKTVEVVVKFKGKPESDFVRIQVWNIPEGIGTTVAGYKATSQIRRTMGNGSTYIEYSLPWVHASSVDSALSEALSFLGERCEPCE